MSRDSMIRGAREANEESHRTAQARALGEAIGGLAAIIAAINKLTERMEAVEIALHLAHGVQSQQKDKQA